MPSKAERPLLRLSIGVLTGMLMLSSMLGFPGQLRAATFRDDEEVLLSISSGVWPGLGQVELPKTPILSLFNQVEERLDVLIVNGTFETGTVDAWRLAPGSAGKLIVGSEDVTGDGLTMVRPYGSDPFFFRLGVGSEPGAVIGENRLSISLPMGLQRLRFAYNFFTTDDIGFDEPGFSVQLEGRELFSLWAMDVPGEWGTLRSSGWQEVDLYLGDRHLAESSLDFLAGNTGDRFSPSFVYLDAVSTQSPLLPVTHLIEASISEESLSLEGRINGAAQQSLDEQLHLISPETRLQLWAEDLAGNQSPWLTRDLRVSAQPPSPPDDLLVSDEGGGHYVFSFTSPSSAERSQAYSLRLTERYPTTENWHSMPEPKRLDPADLGRKSMAPRPAGQAEYVLVESLELRCPWASVRVQNHAGEWSLPSRPVRVESDSCAQQYFEGVTISALMPNPLGRDSAAYPGGEWLELSNDSPVHYDLRDFVLSDAAGGYLPLETAPVILEPFGHEVDRLLPGQRVKVYRNADSDFSMNQNGDQILLWSAYPSQGGDVLSAAWYDQTAEEGQRSECQDFYCSAPALETGPASLEAELPLGVLDGDASVPVLEWQYVGSSGELLLHLDELGAFQTLEYRLVWEHFDPQQSEWLRDGSEGRLILEAETPELRLPLGGQSGTDAWLPDQLRFVDLDLLLQTAAGQQQRFSERLDF